jgi:hypothetical protein
VPRLKKSGLHRGGHKPQRRELPRHDLRTVPLQVGPLERSTCITITYCHAVAREPMHTSNDMASYHRVSNSVIVPEEPMWKYSGN